MKNKILVTGGDGFIGSHVAAVYGENQLPMTEELNPLPEYS